MISVKFILLISILLIITLLYSVYKNKIELSDNEKHYNLVRKYLLNDTPLGQKKPVIWLHLEYKINSRNWDSFYSRNTNQLNQPYLYLTIKSIIEKCGDEFNICLIDDNSFINLLSNWNINLEFVAEPIKSKLRTLAFTKLLYNYGGFLIPPSFLCLKNLLKTFEKKTENNKLFVSDLINRNSTAMDNNLYMNNKFMGCKPFCEKINEYSNYLQILISKDYTDESVFTGEINRWLEDNMESNEINMLTAEELGLVNRNNKVISIEDMLSNINTDLHLDSLGIYIPSNELLMRSKYQWFCRLSPKQVLESQTMRGKYIYSNITQDNK
jgi:hypothetical protein